MSMRYLHIAMKYSLNKIDKALCEGKVQKLSKLSITENKASPQSTNSEQ